MSKSHVVEVQSEAELQKILAEAKGQVVLEFTQEGCGFCEEEGPKVAKLAEKCADLTVVRVDVDKLPKVADDFKCIGTPTLFLAKSGAEMTPNTAKEIEDSSALARVVKCARKK